MKVILLQKVRHLGNLGDTVSVKPGYGRNYLIPQGIAVRATEANAQKFETMRLELEKTAATALATAKQRASALKDFSLRLVRKTMDETKLYGSVSIRDIVDALAEKGILVSRKEISLPTGAIREIGEYQIQLLLHSDVVVPLKLVIEREQ